jgi:hypothetical protein
MDVPSTSLATGADDQHATAGVAGALAAQDVGHAIADVRGELALARHRQAMGAERVRLAPGAGGVDHRAGAQLLDAALALQLQDEVGRLAAAGLDLVEALAADGQDAGAVADMRAQRLRRGERQQVVVAQLAGRGQRQLVGRRRPALAFEQLARRAVDIEAPGREQAYMANRLQMRGRAVTGFEDLHGQATAQQLGGGGQADGAGADHGNRETGGNKGGHGWLLSCSSNYELMRKKRDPGQRASTRRLNSARRSGFTQ